MSLKEKIKEFLFKQILESENLQKYCKPKIANDLNKLLIVDTVTAEYLKELLKTSELTDRGYITIQNIGIILQSLPIHLIYLIKPTLENLKQIVKNISPSSTFISIHIFTIDSISDECIAFIKSNPDLLSKLMTLKEIPLSFVVESQYTFSLSPHMTVPFVFNKENQNTVISEVARQLKDLMIVMNDPPCSIHYMKDSPFTKEIAEVLNKLIEQTEKKVPSFSKNCGEKRPVSLLILHRNFDPRTPFIHDTTFEPMARDLLNIKNNFVELQSAKNTVKLFFDDTNLVWQSLRYQHIADVLSQINTKVKELTASKKIGFSGEKVTVDSLRKMVAKYPAYREIMNFYQGLVELASKLLELHQSMHISEICKAEQDLATNQNTEGEPVSNNPALYVNLLEDVKTPEDRVRILTLFALKDDAGIRQPLLDRLLKLDESGYAEKALNSLEALEFPIRVETVSKRPKPLKRAEPDTTALMGYEDARFIPKIWEILKNFIRGNLDENIFPCLGKKIEYSIQSDEPSKGFEFGKYSKKAVPSVKKAKPAFYVFVIGGISYSENRLLDLAQKNFPESDVYLGSTEFFTPRQFIEHLKSM